MRILNEEQAPRELIEQSRINKNSIIDKIKNQQPLTNEETYYKQEKRLDDRNIDNLKEEYEQKLVAQQKNFDKKVSEYLNQIEELKKQIQIAHQTGYKNGYDEGYYQGKKDGKIEVREEKEIENITIPNEIKQENIQNQNPFVFPETEKKPITNDDNAVNTLDDLIASIFGTSETENSKNNVR